jgi:hypothetical protein
MPDAVPLRAQLQCAKRELARRVRVYPGMIAQDILLTSTAVRELAAQTAIVRTLQGLVREAEAGAVGQAELFGSGGEDHAQRPL